MILLYPRSIVSWCFCILVWLFLSFFISDYDWLNEQNHDTGWRVLHKFIMNHVLSWVVVGVKNTNGNQQHAEMLGKRWEFILDRMMQLGIKEHKIQIMILIYICYHRFVDISDQKVGNYVEENKTDISLPKFVRGVNLKEALTIWYWETC